MRFDSRRIDQNGFYKEEIWRTDVERPEGTTPQAIAYIISNDKAGNACRFYGYYGIHTVSGPTVSAVKQELFDLIEAGH